MSDGRPAPVAAHLRRPWWWLLVVAAALILVVGFSLQNARDDRRRRERSVDVEGTLVDRRTRDGKARVRYVHPTTGQELTLKIPVWDRALMPSQPGRVALDADPEDPEGVRLDGDVHPATAELGWYVPFLAVPLLVWGRRRWGVRRTERLMADPGASFAMLAAIAPVGWRGRRTELHLWPLDAAGGSPSLCRVGLLATGSLPIGGSVFDVEVKGRPRPFGRLVARSPATGSILWPAGAGLPRRPRPRPAASVVPAPPAAEVAAPEGAAAVRPPRVPLALGAALLLAGGLLLAVVVPLSLRGMTEARRAQDGPRVIAEVTDRSSDANRLDVAYTVEGERRTGQAPVGYVAEFPIGRRYPANVDPLNPARLRLAKEHYDPVAPVVWAGLPLLYGAAVLLEALRRWRLATRVARRGGWQPCEMWTGTESTSWATLVRPMAGQAMCSAQLDLPGLGHPPSSPWPIPALVAGDPQPGGRIVVHFHGKTASVRRVGAARRLKWWRPL